MLTKRLTCITMFCLITALAFCNFSNLQRLRREILQVHTFPRNFSSRFLKLDSIIHEEINELKYKINTEHSLGNFKSHLSSSIANVFFIYFCSKGFEKRNPKFQEMIRAYDTVFYEVNQGYASDFLPWLSYFQSKRHTRELEQKSKFIRTFVMEYLMDDRIAKYKRDGLKAEDQEEDYVTSLLDSVYNSKVMDLNTALFSLEDIVGGHTAISNFIMKTLGFLVNHPEVQTKIQEEVYAITQDSRPVNLADRKLMPYTDATILESIRMIASPIVPHVATQDTSIGGKFNLSNVRTSTASSEVHLQLT